MTSRISCDHEVLYEPLAVLAAALEAYVAVNAAGRVVGWNPAAETMFGYTHQQACGHDLADLIIPQRFQAAHRAALARVAAGGSAQRVGQRLQVTARHANGHELPVELSLTGTTSPDGPVFHAFCHDITIAQRATRFAAVEATVTRALVEAASSADAATRITAALGAGMDWPVVELWVFDEQRQLLRCTARHSQSGRALDRFCINELELGVCLPGRVHHAGTPQWVADLAADTTSARHRAASRAGLHVAVGVPVCAGHRIIGALCVYGNRPEDPEDCLTGLLSGLAAQIGQYLQRRHAEELAVELARTKDEFLALVTHELRNPLSVITTTAVLADEEFDTLTTEEHHHHLRTIARSGQRLAMMTDDLLDLARLESGYLCIRPTACDLRPIIDQAVDELEIPIRDKHLKVTTRLPTHLYLHADGDRLRQVADNLLSNAVKYTPDGGAVMITAALTSGRQTITWTVSDTGIGIPPSERPRLFRRFYRASTALDRRIPGTGLGLVITRTIIERHHGTITVGDHPGPGTTFTIELPVGTQQP
ncbi:sensor histidine kinase [Actinoplanes sichuanensis]|uniref:histidine kinase n=1 Tax=Actinoplanes sichuanensis TaxID=512349 RepID=A0ABW4A1K1_9ACTN